MKIIRKTAIILLVLFIIAGVMAQPSEDIMDPGLTPDHPLYFMDRFSDSMELAVAQAPVFGSEELELKVRSNHAEKRLSEARAMMEMNRTDEAERLMQEYSENLNRSTEKARELNDPEINQRLDEVSQRQQSTLRDVRDRVPDQAKSSIDRAIENSQRNRDKIPQNVPNGPETGQSGPPTQNESPQQRDQSGPTGPGNLTGNENNRGPGDLTGNGDNKGPGAFR